MSYCNLLGFSKRFALFRLCYVIKDSEVSPHTHATNRDIESALHTRKRF